MYVSYHNVVSSMRIITTDSYDRAFGWLLMAMLAPLILPVNEVDELIFDLTFNCSWYVHALQFLNLRISPCTEIIITSCDV